MKELKTLKEIDQSIIPLKNREETNHLLDVYREELRKEAINWIKTWQKYQLNPQTDSEFYMMKQAKINWVKHFFNITDEELK